MSTPNGQISYNAHNHYLHALHGQLQDDEDAQAPKGRPIDRGFGHRFAVTKGFSSIVRAPRASARGVLLAPEEIIHNDLLREQVEGNLDTRPGRTGQAPLRWAFVAACEDHVDASETALRQTCALSVGRGPIGAHKGATCQHPTGTGRCGEAAVYLVRHKRELAAPRRAPRSLRERVDSEPVRRSRAWLD